MSTLEPLESRICMSSGTANVVNQGAKVEGQTLGAWSAAWWQWAVSFPAASNPILDATGKFGSQGQPDKVFFLAGTAGSGPTVRDITIPTGTRTFFPVLNSIFIQLPGDPPLNEDRALLDEIGDAYQNMFTQIDGKSVANLPGHREVDPYVNGFNVELPVDNIFGVPAGTYGPSVSDGVWIMTEPFSKGDHTIHFGGDDPAFGNTVDVTYHLHVVPQGQYKKTAPGGGGGGKSAGFSDNRLIASDIKHEVLDNATEEVLV